MTRHSFKQLLQGYIILFRGMSFSEKEKFCISKGIKIGREELKQFCKDNRCNKWSELDYCIEEINSKNRLEDLKILSLEDFSKKYGFKPSVVKEAKKKLGIKSITGVELALQKFSKDYLHKVLLENSRQKASEVLKVGTGVIESLVKELGIKKTKEEINQTKQNTLNSKYSYVSTEQLNELRDKNYSLKEIAEKTNLPLKRVSKVLEDTEMEWETSKVRKTITPEAFYHYYIEEDLSIAEIACKFDLNETALYNVSRMDFKVKKDSLITRKLSKEILLEEFNKTNNSYAIAEKLGVSHSTLWEAVKQFGLEEIKDAIIKEFHSLFPSFKVNVWNVIPNQELDFYDSDKKVAIEYNGSYWHSQNAGKDKYYHQKKSLACRERGIRLIHIYEDEWFNPRKKELLKSLISNALSETKLKLMARKCEVKEVSDLDYKNFCIKNHLQGYSGATVKLGLYYRGELVQIASFGKSRYDVKYEWEWIRGCPASLHNVVGGTSKLFKYFIRTYHPKSVVCYADLNKFDGAGYESCGFKLVTVTPPDKFYIDKDLKRIGRNPSKYKEYMEGVKKNRLLLTYGAGNLKYDWQQNRKEI